MQVQAIALAGMTAAVDSFSKSADQIASGSGDDLAKGAVDQSQDELAFKANAAVLRTADQMSGTLLDMKV